MICAAALLAAAACTTTPDATTSTTNVTGPSTSAGAGDPDLPPSSPTTATPPTSAPPIELSVAVDELRLPAVRAAADRFEETSGVTIDLVVGDYPALVGLVDEVDALIGSHVDLQRLARDGRIVPIDLGQAGESFERVALDALTVAGATYGVPFSADVIAMLWNPGLVADAPRALGDIPDLCSDLPAGVICLAMAGGSDVSLLHHSPILNAGEGAVFAPGPAGDWNEDDRRLLAAVPALEAFATLIDEGLVPALDAAGARRAFLDGAAALYVTGPWDLGILEDAGLDFEVAPFPRISGVPAASFVGVQAMAISAASPQPGLVEAFLRDDIATLATQQAMYDADRRVPVFDGVEEFETGGGFAVSLAAGEPIPTLAAMDSAWQAVGVALRDLRTGRASARTAMEAAEASLAEEIRG